MNEEVNLIPTYVLYKRNLSLHEIKNEARLITAFSYI